MELLQQTIDILRIPEPLPKSNKEHNLSGNYSGYKECHIEPDWLLIYRYSDGELLLNRTGNHSDLFNM
jgi:mRNA interferase YafQ